MNLKPVKHLLLASSLLLIAFLAGCGGTNSTSGPGALESKSDAAAELSANANGAFGSEGEAEETSPECPESAKWISGPAVITEPGDYRLAGDFETKAGDGIVIRASNVRLWLGERRLTGPGNKAGRAVVLDGVQQVTVLGGRVSRFGMGAVLLGTQQSHGGLDSHDAVVRRRQIGRAHV